MSLQPQVSYEFGPFRLNPAQQLLAEGTKRVPLTPKAFRILLALVESQGQILSKEELLQKVWPDTFVEEATLAQNVFNLGAVQIQSKDQPECRQRWYQSNWDASTAFTLDTYAHVLPHMQDEAATNVEALLFGKESVVAN